MLLSLCACQGKPGQVTLWDAMPIPEDGILPEHTLVQLQTEQAIGIFTGSSNGYSYRWTVFGSQIAQPRQVNLAAEIEAAAEGGVKIVLAQTEAFGFSALLSVTVPEKWEAQSATAYAGGAAAAIFLTGSKATTLTLPLDGSARELVVQPDPPESQPTQPAPAGSEEQSILSEKTGLCTLSIECTAILNNLGELAPEKLEMVPFDGVILEPTTVTFHEGESVFDVLQRVCRDNGIPMEAAQTPLYRSAYVEGIHNLYEFDCGSLSGWTYRVNGWYPNYGCSQYRLVPGDVVQWRYTCDLGNDVGGGSIMGD